mmetsp:Transcript_28267/g.79809  ORF Transcript_28267/g.79809 Transcript_28267/m.79809 type:complete len:94 (-) Transcript_28267:1125-1406(-)
MGGQLSSVCSCVAGAVQLLEPFAPESGSRLLTTVTLLELNDGLPGNGVLNGLPGNAVLRLEGRFSLGAPWIELGCKPRLVCPVLSGSPVWFVA